VNLRFASPEDAERLAGVHAVSFERSWTASDIARLMQIMGGFAIVAEDRGIAGFILARTMGGESEILTLAVEPQARRAGVGAALVEAASAHAEALGARALFLEVAADNAAARAVYARAGFEEAGLRRAYYARRDAPAMDAVVLRRALNSPES
jgi:ribosomal-protein-alanine N-acetyltransferase